MSDMMLITPAARLLGLSASGLRALAMRGKVPYTCTSNGIRLFRRADIEAELERRSRETAGKTEPAEMHSHVES